LGTQILQTKANVTATLVGNSSDNTRKLVTQAIAPSFSDGQYY